MENIESQENLDMLGAELHAITSAAKPVSGWLIRDAIQSCREACGGHGYLKGNANILVPQQELKINFRFSFGRYSKRPRCSFNLRG